MSSRKSRSLVRLDARDGIGELTLARASMGNALVPDLLLDLCVALEEVARRDALRAVVLAADGEPFSIGGDMRRFAHEMQGPSLQTYSAELVGLLNQAILAMLRLPQPIVVAVDGLVTGGSLGLVLAGDLVVVSDRALFKAHYASAGFTPDGGWTALLPRLVGTRRAAAGLLLNRTIRAAEALEWGLATERVPAGEALAAARAAAARIARQPAITMRAAKRLLCRDLPAIEDALEAERQAFVASIGGAEARAGVPRFLAAFADYPGGTADGA